ncbi:MAG: hypothetical protein Ct9H300mP1_32110 [Planctomycetaceae bacterium]|nr:MAG: hypothetical protein Ct9H300mP1_32110 [Planctomycetaceae bacterium]
MIRRWPQLGLPLLTKELIEQAAQRRTYFVRLLYASLLFLLAYLEFERILAASGSNTLAMLGKGTDMFHQRASTFSSLASCCSCPRSPVVPSPRKRNATR